MKHKKTSQTNKGTGHGTGGIMQRTISKRGRLRFFEKPSFEQTPGAHGGHGRHALRRASMLQLYRALLLNGIA